jgi:hypothetical protein
VTFAIARLANFAPRAVSESWDLSDPFGVATNAARIDPGNAKHLPDSARPYSIRIV